jgi:hypothetical protein
MNAPTGSPKWNPPARTLDQSSTWFSEKVRLICGSAAERLNDAACLDTHSVLGEYQPVYDFFEAILYEDGRLVAEIIRLHYAATVSRTLHLPDQQDVVCDGNPTQNGIGFELSGTRGVPQADEAGQRGSKVSVYLSSQFENDIAIAQPDLGRTVILMIAPKGARQISQNPADRARLMFSRARRIAIEARQEFSGGLELMHIEALILDLTLDGPSAEAGIIGLCDLDEYLCTGDSIGTQFIPHYRAELTALIDEHALWRTTNMIRRRLVETAPYVSSKSQGTGTTATADKLSRTPIATVRLGEPPALASGQ